MSKEEFVAWAVRNAENHVVGIYADKRDADQIKGQWGVEIIELVEKSTQAAANKAAEEGELPALPAAYQEAGEDAGCWFPDFFTESHMREYARAAIAADRASRQVANKAQQDIWGPNGEFAEFYVAGFEGREICPTTKGNALAAYSNGIKDRVANKAEVEPEPFAYVKFRAAQNISSEGDVDANEWYEFCEQEDVGDDKLPAFPVYATPPATTGASTEDTEFLKFTLKRHMERVAELEAARIAYASEFLLTEDGEPDVGNIHANIRALKAKVGASTVLTDERIKAICAEVWNSGQADFPGTLARAIEREVAAQAGQVAVPEWISVDASLPDGKYCLATYQDRAGKLRIIRAMYVRQFEIEANGDECDSETNEADDMEYLKAGWYELIDNWGEYSSVHVSEGPVTHWMPLPAAPSPAKESK